MRRSVSSAGSSTTNPRPPRGAPRSLSTKHFSAGPAQGVEEGGLGGFFLLARGTSLLRLWGQGSRDSLQGQVDLALPQVAAQEAAAVPQTDGAHGARAAHGVDRQPARGAEAPHEKLGQLLGEGGLVLVRQRVADPAAADDTADDVAGIGDFWRRIFLLGQKVRSEERRVGKEW